MLDRIIELQVPERATGVKCVSLSDDFFVDHFPGHPVMPGALILEAMAQLGGVLVEQSLKQQGFENRHALLVKADQLKFKKTVHPGDSLFLEAKTLVVLEDGAKTTTTASVNNKVVAEAELTFAFTKVKNPITISRRQEVLNTWLYGAAEEP